MGLDVGVVKIKYTEAPKEPARSFLIELAAGDFGVGWGGGWDGNVFLEMYKEDLEGRAREYASQYNLSHCDAAKVLSWIRGLPWEGDDIMLHLNW